VSRATDIGVSRVGLQPFFSTLTHSKVLLAEASLGNVGIGEFF